MGFPSQEYWNGLPFPFPGSFVTQGRSHISCVAGRFFITEPQGRVSLLCIWKHREAIEHAAGDVWWVLDLEREWFEDWVYLYKRDCVDRLPCGSVDKNLPAIKEMQVWSLGWKDPLEKEMAAHSSILAWETSWTVEPGGLQSIGSQRVGEHLPTKQQWQIISMEALQASVVLSVSNPSVFVWHNQTILTSVSQLGLRLWSCFKTEQQSRIKTMCSLDMLCAFKNPGVTFFF